MTFSNHNKSKFKRSLGFASYLIAIILVNSLKAETPSVEGTMPEDFLPGLKPILESALKQSPQMILSGIGIAQADSARIISDSRWYPGLSGVASYSLSSIAAASNPASKIKSDGITYVLSVSQSLFQFGAVKNQSAAARIGVLISEKSYLEAYRGLALNLRQQYLQLVVRKATLAGLRNRVLIIESNLEGEEQKLKLGTISPGDIIAPRLAVDEARLAVARAELEYANARLVLARLAGLKELADDSIPSEIGKPIFDAGVPQRLGGELRRDNASNIPAIQISALYVRQADLSYRIAKVGLMPKFSAGASAVQSNSATVVNGLVYQDAVQSNSVSVTGSWSIFDGFATSGSKKSALSTKRLYERLLQTQTEQTLDTAKNLELSLALSYRALELTETRSKLAEAAMNRAKEESQLGNIPKTTVDESVAAYIVGQAGLASGRAEFLSRWVEFVSLVGSDPAIRLVNPRYAR